MSLTSAQPSSSSGDAAITGGEALKCRLPLTCTAVLDNEVDLQFWLLVHGEQAISKMRGDFWIKHSPWYAGFALGLYASLEARMLFVACVILTLAASLINYHWQQHKAGKVYTGVGLAPQKVVIELHESGITEIDRLVESRLPWQSMRRWILTRDILFVELTNTRWLIIPQKKLEPEGLTISSIAELLTLNGVEQQVLAA